MLRDESVMSGRRDVGFDCVYSVQRGDEQEDDLQKAPWPCEQRVRVLARAAVGSLSVSVYSLNENVREHRDLDGRLRAELPVDRLDAPATNRGCNQVEIRPGLRDRCATAEGLTPSGWARSATRPI